MGIVNTFLRKKKTVDSLISRYFLSMQERAYFDVSRGMQKRFNNKSATVVLVQCVEDYYYMGLFAIIAAELRKSENVLIEQLVVRNLKPGSSKSAKAAVFSFLFTNWFTDSKWTRLYSAFCDGIAYRHVDFGMSLRDILEMFHARSAWKKLRSKDDLLNLSIDSVAVGDLVYDSYLRFKPAETADLGDFYLWLVIWQAYRNVRLAKCYFARIKPRLFFTSYSSYIQHGIPARVALMQGVKVFSLGNYQEFVKELTLQDWFHTRAHEHYRQDWLKVENQEQKLVQAEQGLSARISGGIDAATAYMRQSAYADIGEKVPDVSGAVVVFLHDFFDSPHCHQWMLFPDFWEWVEHTIQVARANRLKIFWKPHPNQIAASVEVVAELASRYPDIQLLSSRITNKQLVDAGIACAITVYGTVAHELAYLGVPVIACGDHPHISFDFCFTARTVSEYDRLVAGYTGLVFDREEMRRQSLAFYFMHSLNVSVSERALLKAMEQYRSRFYLNDTPPDAAEYQSLLSGISEQPAFANRIRDCWDASSLELNRN